MGSNAICRHEFSGFYISFATLSRCLFIVWRAIARQKRPGAWRFWKKPLTKRTHTIPKVIFLNFLILFYFSVLSRRNLCIRGVETRHSRVKVKVHALLAFDYLDERRYVCTYYNSAHRPWRECPIASRIPVTIFVRKGFRS